MGISTASACSPPSVFRPAPRLAYDRYAQSLRDAGLDSTALGREWLAASDSALRTPLTASLPAREIGFYSRTEARAVAYSMSLREGQRVRVTLRADGLPARLYLDLYEVTGDSATALAHRATALSAPLPDTAAAMLSLDYEAHATATYVVRLQPELLRSGRYELTIRAEPVLAFPVQGKSNGAIQSFWGADRDAGARDHQGIDIFAARGTPVLAATDGIVRSIAPNALGGNVVWLADAKRGQSLYYAHLDRHYVAEGQQVRVGDTLGFVGNTGNARTTTPHLHFGIYRRGQGAIDPLAWVRRTDSVVPSIKVDTTRLGGRGAIKVAAAAIRSGPRGSAAVVRRVVRDTRVAVMAASNGWYRVQLDDGLAGYLEAGAIRTEAR